MSDGPLGDDPEATGDEAEGSGAGPDDADTAGDTDTAGAATELDTGDLVERSSLKRNVAQLGTSQVLSWTLTTISSMVIPRILGPETNGMLTLAVSLWAVAGVFTGLGTSMYLQLVISQNQREGVAAVAPTFVARNLAFVIAALAIGIYAFAVVDDTLLRWIIVLTGVGSMFTMWTDMYSAVFMGLERMGPLARTLIAVRAFYLLAVFAVLGIGYGVRSVVWIGLFAAIVSWIALRRRLGRLIEIPRRADRASVVALVRASVPFMAVTLAVAVYRQIDIIVISEVAGKRDVGWYGAADTLAGSILFPTNIVLAAAFPTLSRLDAHDPAALRRLVERVFGLLMLVAVPMGLGAAIVGPTFAPLLYGGEYDGAGEALMIFGPVSILTFCTTLLANVALATRRRRFLVAMLVGSAVATIPLDMVLVPWASDRFDNGAIGGALAYVITEAAQFALGIAVLAPFLISRRVVSRTVRVLAAGGVMCAAAWPFREMLFVLPVAVGAVTYPLAALLFRALDAEQRNDLSRVVAKLGSSRRSRRSA